MHRQRKFDRTAINLQSAAATRRRGGCLPWPLFVICQAMQANAKPAAAPGDGAPGAEEPALIKMSNQHTKLSQARSEEPAPTKLNDQHNTHPMPVRAHNGRRAVPWPEHALRTAISLYSSSLSYPNPNAATEGRGR